MTGLSDPISAPKVTNSLRIKRNKTQQPEAVFGDDDVDLSTVGGDTDDILAMASKRKKDIPTVNHAKVAYLTRCPFSGSEHCPRGEPQ